MVKRLFIGIFTVALLSFSWHKYFVSITEAAYNSTSQKLEISVKFIGHDLEKALSDHGTPELHLGTDKEAGNANEYLESMIEKHLRFIAGEHTLDLKLIGKEINNDDFIYCYLETEKTDLPEKLTIKNSLLVHTFPEQKNTLYLKVNGKTHTLYFDKGKQTETIEI
ncbi:MAG: hypothetical protein KDD41_00425 [Flavobacteriales bacterium]|nr:hypothetical protein [Flavobacteriales bacterium]